MRIAQPSRILAYLPLYIAIEGKDYEVISYDGAKKSIEAVIRGEADISVGDPFMFNYLDYEQLNIVIFAGFIKKVFHSLITFNPFITKASKADLAGKIIVTYPEPSTSFFIVNNLKQEYKLGNIIQTPFNTELGPLLTQEADIAIIMEPNTSYALKNGAKELIDFTNINMAVTGFCCEKNYYNNSKKEINEFLEFLVNGIKILEKDNETSFRIAKKYFPLVEDTILKEAIDKLRKANVYCKDFRFTDEDIKEGLRIRKIDMPLQKVKNVIVF